MEQIEEILKIAKSKGLKNVSIVIFDSKNELQEGGANNKEINDYTLVVGKQDRFVGNSSINRLKKSIEDHDDLSWMNK